MKLIVFLSLVLCLSAFAQPNPINRRAMAIAGLASSPVGVFPSGMYLRWVATDVPNNNVVSNQWADRIQGVLLQQGDPTKQPTNSTSGVYFNGTWYLTNVPQAFVAGGGGFAVLVVIDQDVTTGTQMLITDSTHTGDGIPQFNTGGGSTFWVRGAAGSDFQNLKFVNPGNVLHDIMFTPTNGAAHATCFTNGVATPCDIAANTGQPNMVGFGRESGGTQLYHGWLRELIVWTNQTSFSSLNVSNIHYYCTNTYGFTP